MRGFGDSNLVTHYDLDSFNCGDSFFMITNFNNGLSDAAVPADSLKIIDTFSDSITESEVLVFNAGFGCSLAGADGFGSNTFGR